jgi:hypothetical protein
MDIWGFIETYKQKTQLLLRTCRIHVNAIEVCIKTHGVVEGAIMWALELDTVSSDSLLS